MTQSDFISDIFDIYIAPALRAEKIYVAETDSISWYGYLGNFHPSTIKRVFSTLTSAPKTYQIKEACMQLEDKSQTRHQTKYPDYQGDHYRDLMKQYSADWDQFRRFIANDETLPELYKIIKRTVGGYMTNAFGYFNLKERLQEVGTGFYCSYHGLFCEARAHELLELTGKKKGNLNYSDALMVKSTHTPPNQRGDV